MLSAGGTLAGSGLVLALLAGGLIPALIGFALVGLGIAAVSPCVYAAAAKNGPVALASVTTMGSVGGLLGPPVIGFISHASSFSWGMAVIAMAAWLVAAGTRKVRWD
jgi:MFS family permease